MGPTARTVADNIRRLREARGMSLRALSAELKQVGRNLSADALNKIENGRTLPPEAETPRQIRRADVDDLMALAVVFRVNPSALLLPYTAEGYVAVTGAGEVDARIMWRWADGFRPLDVPDDDDGTALMDFQRHARPTGARRYGLHAPGRQAFREDTGGVGEAYRKNGRVYLRQPEGCPDIELPPEGEYLDNEGDE